MRRVLRGGGGIQIEAGAHHNVIERCIISGNRVPEGEGGLAAALFIFDGAHSNVVRNCRIGLNADGGPLPNDVGVGLGNPNQPTENNTIGGARTLATNPGNVISGNAAYAITLAGAGTTGNRIAGNMIGVDPTGSIAIPNGTAGTYTAVLVGSGASGNIIGGNRLTQTGGDGNIISGNTGNGMRIRLAGTTGNQVMGNLIGTDLTGTVLIPNGGAGIMIERGLSDNVIGNSKDGLLIPSLGNVIAGNAGPGIVMVDDATVRNTVRLNEIRDNGGLGIDLTGNDRAAGDHVTPNDLGDVDAGPNGLQNYPVGITAWYNAATGTTIVSGLMPVSEHQIVYVDIYANRTVDAAGFGEGERYLGSTIPNEGGVFFLEVPGSLPAGLPFLSATTTDADGNTSEFSPVCGDPDGDGNPDTDGDGLCDDWELRGIDYDGDGAVDLALHQAPFSADPRHKDLFVEIDYMEAGDHTHRPDLRPDKRPLDADPMLDVRIAFANAPVMNPDGTTGIRLHLMVDEALPDIPELQFKVDGDGETDDYDDLKLGSPRSLVNGHFGTVDERASTNAENILGARLLAFRYGLFAHTLADEPRVGGIAEIGGDDIMLCLANWEGPARDVAAAFSSTGTVFATEEEFNAEWLDVVASVFMHELGHTLGLRHGGGQGIPELFASNRDVNRKPNYLSIMNYSLKFNSAGDAASLPGVPDGRFVRLYRPLDYSRSALATLDENHLNEPVGIGGPSGRLTLYGYLGEPRIGPASGPVDWNGNGTPDGVDLKLDVNYIRGRKGGEESPGEMLRGHGDWANLICSFRASEMYGKAVREGALLPDEMTADDYLRECLGGEGNPQDALKIAGGLLRAEGPDVVLLDLAAGDSTGRVDLLDAVRRARQAAGLEP